MIKNINISKDQWPFFKGNIEAILILRSVESVEWLGLGGLINFNHSVLECYCVTDTKN